MAALTGQSISSTYDSLLKVTDNGPITSSNKTITDGLGNSTSLQLSSISAIFTGTVVTQSSLDVSAEIYHRNNIAVLNKVGNSWVHWASRDTSGAESVINLSNIGNITLGGTLNKGAYTYTLPSATGTLALTSDLSSYVPNSRTLTINGTAYDLSADRTWSVGTVTSVAALTLGTSGTDLNSTVANGTTTPVITLNVPDASATARGVVTTGTQTIAGNKTFTSSPIISGGNALQVESGTTGNYVYLQSPAGLGGSVTVTLPSSVGTLALTSQIPTNPVGGTGTTNELAYFTGSTTIASLTTATYPSLTELSYVKGVTSAIQTQLNGKQATLSLTTTGTSGAATLVGSTLNIPNYGSALSGYLPLTGGTLTGKLTISSVSGLYFQSNRNSTDAQFEAWYESNGTTRRGYLGYAEANNNLYLYNELNGTLYLGVNGSYQIQVGTSLVSFASAISGSTGSFTGGVNLATSSGNVLIGTTTDAGYKLDVNGTGRFSGVVTSKSGTYSGFVADNNSTTGGGYFNVKQNGNNVGTFGVSGAIIGNTESNVALFAETGKSIQFMTNGSVTPVLTLASTGAATFSSSVSATSYVQGDYFQTGATPATSGGVRLGTQVAIRARNVANTANIPLIESTSGDAVAIASGGANVLINTTTDAGYKLDVNGTGRFSSTLNVNYPSITAGNAPASSGTTPVNPMLNLTNNRGVGMYFGGSYSGSYAQWIQVADTTNLGVYYPLSLQTNGGNVGIGTTTDAGYKLDVNGRGRFSSSISNDYILNAFNTNTTAGTSFGLFIKAGTNSSDFALNVNNAANTVTLFQVKGDGAATFSSSVTATGFFESSSILLKDIISRDGDVAYFKWKDNQDDKIHIGYIAEEVQLTNPDQVNSDGEYLAVNYIELLVQKVRDLEKRIKQLENA